MGDKLKQLYDFVDKHGGFEAKMRVAIKTTISSLRAEEVTVVQNDLEMIFRMLKSLKKKVIPAKAGI
jgi:seryl-tRNA(Sec) selenium transferase